LFLLVPRQEAAHERPPDADVLILAIAAL
jgi:hypothetical protein